jgi:hypothetical protein
MVIVQKKSSAILDLLVINIPIWNHFAKYGLKKCQTNLQCPLSAVIPAYFRCHSRVFPLSSLRISAVIPAYFSCHPRVFPLSSPRRRGSSRWINRTKLDYFPQLILFSKVYSISLIVFLFAMQKECYLFPQNKPRF